MNLTKEQVKELEFEELPKQATIDFTRLVRLIINDNYFLGLRFINMKETILDKKVTKPVFDDYSESLTESLTLYIMSSIEDIFNNLELNEVVELLFDYIQLDLMDITSVNNILKKYEIPVLFEQDNQHNLNVKTENIEDIPVSKNEHPNIKQLISRMDNNFANNDYAGVLHASASIYETLVKDIAGAPKFKKMSLGQILNDSAFSLNIPEQIMEYIREIFKKRNTVPTAGHGGVSIPTITEEEAIVIQEFTKAIVRVLRKIV